MAQEKVVKVKVQPYPFAAELDHNGVKKPISVVLVNHKGLIANVGIEMLKVGDHYNVNFQLPGLQRIVQSHVRVIKTYDRTVKINEHKVERLAEFHFVELRSGDSGAITDFMKAIRQA